MEKPNKDRRTHTTPFSSVGRELFDSKGVSIGVILTPQLAAYIVKTANNFDRLMRAVVGCRGEIESNVTVPITRPLLKDLLTLIDELERE